MLLLAFPLTALAQEPESCLDRASEAAYEECLQMRFDQRDGFGLEDAQIILETLGIEDNLRSGDEGEENVYAARLNRIAEIVITKAAYDDARTLTVEGFIMLYDGSEHRFRMHWAERMNGGLEVVVPVG